MSIEKKDVEADVINIAKLQQTKVLLIDDDRTARRMVSMAIGDFCNLEQAIDAKAAKSKFEEFAPNLVFLDLDLPDESGHNLLKWILENQPKTDVVLFSAHCDEENIKMGKDNGAFSYVKKPFNPSHMIYHIHNASRLQGYRGQ